MRLQLPDTVSSQQDVTALLLELQTYARWFAHNDRKARLGTKHTSHPPVLSDGALALVRASTGKKLLDQKMLDDLVAELKAHHASATVITITLAAPATADVKKALVSWCRTNIASDVLVSFQLNTTLLGGMVVRFGSHIFDWSFRRQILASKASFPEVLKRV